MRCSWPRSLPIGVSVSSRVCAAIRPTHRISFGFTSSIWRNRYGMQARTSSGRGSRLFGGRDLRMFAMNTCSRCQADRLEHRVEQLTGAADERLALAILVRARRLADHHPLRVAIADAEHALGPRLVQRAQRAASSPRARARAQPGCSRRSVRRVRCCGGDRRRDELSERAHGSRRSQTSTSSALQICDAARIHRSGHPLSAIRYPLLLGRPCATPRYSGADSA